MECRTTMYKVFLKDQKRRGMSKEKADRLWATMTRKEREPYRKRAKDFHEGIVQNVSIPAELQKSYMDRMVEDLLINKGRMKRIIKDQVERQFEIGKLDDFTFAILSIEHFYEFEHDIYPCELALAKFSLKQGVKETMSIQINPGALPEGSLNEAILHSQETHQYPLPKAHDKEESYIEVLLKIIRFLRPEFNELPMFFCEGGTIDNRSEQKLLINTRRALKKILEEAGEYEIAHDLQVFPLSYLFHRLQKCINEAKGLSIGNVDDLHFEYKENQFFTFNTEGCEYHDAKDRSKFCCLSKVRRFGYSIAHFCAQPCKYGLIPGQHFPKNFYV